MMHVTIGLQNTEKQTRWDTDCALARWTSNDFHWLSEVLGNFTGRIYLVEISVHTELLSSLAASVCMCVCLSHRLTQCASLSLLKVLALSHSLRVTFPSFFCSLHSLQLYNALSNTQREEKEENERQTGGGGGGGGGSSGRNKWL